MTLLFALELDIDFFELAYDFQALRPRSVGRFGFGFSVFVSVSGCFSLAFCLVALLGVGFLLGASVPLGSFGFF